MKITFISDTHGQHNALQLPEADMLVHTGDISSAGEKWQVREFLKWMAEQPHRHKVFIGGNHDFLLEREPLLFHSLIPKGITYLENTATVIEGIKIWGSPITPWFLDWAFNEYRGDLIRRYWERIPEDIDILLTHGPPLGYGDRTIRGEIVGCEDLLEFVRRIQPRYHVFGHIHEGYGQYESEGTSFINASVLDVRYNLVNAPVTVEYSA
ncbi:MAG: metallophosphatase domain-containing protein [Bacteroidota bacterium]